MPDSSIGEHFDAKAAPPPLMAAEEYRALLEKLLTEGKGYGKTSPVAAYKLTDIELDQTDGNGLVLGRERIEIKPVYVIMDMKYLPNDFGRYVTLKDIALQYVKKQVGLNDINNPDFKGQEVWTAKPSAFEEDYIRRTEVNELGKQVDVYDPNPNAFRLAMVFNGYAKMPTGWGDWLLTPGGAVTVREKDIPALAAALNDIRAGRATAEDALYTTNDNGARVAKFDVYGMAPGFLEDNYKPVDLKPGTLQLLQDEKQQQLPKNKTKPPARTR